MTRKIKATSVSITKRHYKYPPTRKLFYFPDISRFNIFTVELSGPLLSKFCLWIELNGRMMALLIHGNNAQRQESRCFIWILKSSGQKHYLPKGDFRNNPLLTRITYGLFEMESKNQNNTFNLFTGTLKLCQTDRFL